MDMSKDYLVKRVEELHKELMESKKQRKAYFDALCMIIAFQPEWKVELSKDLIRVFNPSNYHIEQTEDLINGSITLRLKERGKEYGDQRGVSET